MKFKATCKSKDGEIREWMDTANNEDELREYMMSFPAIVEVSKIVEVDE